MSQSRTWLTSEPGSAVTSSQSRYAVNIGTVIGYNNPGVVVGSDNMFSLIRYNNTGTMFGSAICSLSLANSKAVFGSAICSLALANSNTGAVWFRNIFALTGYNNTGAVVGSDNMFTLIGYSHSGAVVGYIFIIILQSRYCKTGRVWMNSVSPKAPTTQSQPTEKRKRKRKQ